MRKEQKVDTLELLNDKEVQEWKKYQQHLELAIENH